MDTKDRILDTILSNVRAEVLQFLEIESEIKCPIEFELKVIEASRVFARTLISQSQLNIPKSRNLKKK
jgi:hypothetical protein